MVHPVHMTVGRNHPALAALTACESVPVVRGYLANGRASRCSIVPRLACLLAVLGACSVQLLLLQGDQAGSGRAPELVMAPWFSNSTQCLASERVDFVNCSLKLEVMLLV